MCDKNHQNKTEDGNTKVDTEFFKSSEEGMGGGGEELRRMFRGRPWYPLFLFIFMFRLGSPVGVLCPVNSVRV